MGSEPLKTLKGIQLPIRRMYLKFGRIILHSSTIELMDKKTWRLNPKRKQIQTGRTLTSWTRKWKKSMKESGRHASGCIQTVVRRYSPTNDTTDQQCTWNWRM